MINNYKYYNSKALVASKQFLYSEISKKQLANKYVPYSSFC